MNRKKWIIYGSVIVVALAVALAGFGLHRWSVKKKEQAAYNAFIEKNFRELEEKSIQIGHEKEALALAQKQMAGRRAELKKEIVKLKELVTFLEQ